ncbi:hypothetical protein OG607_41010 [Streptomyces sp. NBC_01537]|uniref:hypothetical protein n=1 Tax=Streptomyces sp. NBC_01537 TaxID=2903896 RepID=UPI003869D5F2
MTVLFCFKSRHGLGNARRTVLIARALSEVAPGMRIVLMGQGRPAPLLRGCGFPVVNLPVLDRLPNDALDAAYLSLLKSLVIRISPSIIVEDTYPDPRHLFLEPFRDLPKVLVMSGMTRGSYLERLRQDRHFRHFDRILVARERGDVVGALDLTRATRTVLDHTRVRFCGPVFTLPDAGEVAAAGAAYSPGGDPLVVVSAGAGGDITTQAYPERLFGSMAEVAVRLHRDGVAARVVIVAGPHYRGVEPSTPPNTLLVRFAPDLPALLHAARVAVIRPGSNVLRETLSGPATTIVVPNFSWAEDQRATADLVTGSLPQVMSAAHDDPDQLHELTLAGLSDPLRPPWSEARASSAGVIAAEILATLEERTPARPSCFLYLSGLGTAERRATVERLLPGIPCDGDDPRIRLFSTVPGVEVSPAVLHDDGVRLLLIPAGESADSRHGVNYDPGYGYDLPVWRRAHHPADHGLAVAEVHHLRALQGAPGALAYRLTRLRERTALPAVWIDLRAVADSALPSYTAALAAALAASGCRSASVTEFVDHHVSDQLM